MKVSASEVVATELAVAISRRVGSKAAKALNSLGVHTVGDLIRHYPRRYVDRGELTDLSQLERDEHVTVLARVQTVHAHAMRGRPGWRVQIVISEGHNELDLVFFTGKQWQRDKLSAELSVGTVGLFSGKVGQYQGRRQLLHPMYDVLPAVDEGVGVAVDAELQGAALALAQRPIPIYPAGTGIQSWQIRAAVELILPSLPPMPELLPATVLTRRGLLPIDTAIAAIHAPDTLQQARQARRRLIFDEAFVLQAMLLSRKAAVADLASVPRPVRSAGILEAFDARLPFDLTEGQRSVGEQIAMDLASAHPMHRLLQGEVGSGKTLVALRAMLTVVDAGGQAVLLAPTEVLATQHHRSISRMLGDLAEKGWLGGGDIGTRVALLTGSQAVATRRTQLLEIASGAAGIVVGTHALLEDQVQFADLGLVVVDEQHRFGVEQRDALRAKASVPPHLLVMTATPIPRTVAMTVFGDLDTSILTEVPPGRSPVISHLVPSGQSQWMARTWQRVAEEVAVGHQVFVVCPRIDGDEKSASKSDTSSSDDVDESLLDAASLPASPPRAVLDVLQELRSKPELTGLRIEELHGRLPADQRDATMSAFAAGRIDVLVATTVVEVGVDVPNATMMVVLDADRFGVSQLHQLRGRIGRGSAPGVALLVTEAAVDSPAWQRVQAVAATADGFELARLDLQQRREGDVLGSAQSGFRSSLRLLRVLRDEQIIADARHDAEAVLADDPQLGQHPVLAAALVDLAGSGRDEYLERG